MKYDDASWHSGGNFPAGSPPEYGGAENAAEFAWQRDDVFGRIASRYDLLCDLFSVGIL